MVDWVPEGSGVCEMYAGVGVLGLSCASKAAFVRCSDVNSFNPRSFERSRYLLAHFEHMEFFLYVWVGGVGEGDRRPFVFVVGDVVVVVVLVFALYHYFSPMNIDTPSAHPGCSSLRNKNYLMHRL